MKHVWLDLRRDKTRAIFGILGIGTSIFLLTAIGMVNDSLNYSTVRDMNDVTGKTDIIIMRAFQTDITFDYAFDSDIIEKKLNNIHGVEEFFPRALMPITTSSDNTNKTGTLEVYGIDFQKEHENGNMGDLYIVDEGGNRTDVIYDEEPDEGECVITWKTARLLNVSRGDIVHLEYNQWNEDYEVVEICEPYLKFMQFEDTLVILDLAQFQAFFHRPGQINHVVGRIENAERFYNAKNIDQLNRDLRQIANNVQDRLDLNRYQVIMPKLEVLEAGQIALEFIAIFFWLITIFSMLITGILINSILSTSAEERLREFGILRVVGGKKKFNIQLVLFEGLLYGIFGTLIGLAMAFFIALPLVVNYIYYTDPTVIEVKYMIYPETIAFIISLGILLPLIISLIPAIKVARKDLVKSLSPHQMEAGMWEVKKEGSMDFKRFIMGLSIASVGLIVFVLIPQIVVVGNITLMGITFIGLLSAILIGLVLATIGFVPIIQKILLRLSRPFTRKYSPIIKVNLSRYKRRNASTIIMFAISYSFIFFITGINQMLANNTAYTVNYLYGSDLAIVNQGTTEDLSSVDLRMLDELQYVEGIDEISYALHNTYDIQAALSLISDIQDENPKFIEDLTANQAGEILNFYEQKIETSVSIKVADISRHDEIDSALIGIDKEFVNMVDEDLIIWNSIGSNFNHSFTELFKNNKTCIIAKSIANRLGIYEVGERIRLTCFNPFRENDPGNITLFTVVGITGGIPGFYNFRESELYSYLNPGILVSSQVYTDLMNIENAGKSSMVIDKIFINLLDNSEENVKNTMERIKDHFIDYNFIIDDAITKINMVNEGMEGANQLIELLFFFSVLVANFGLISTMYATLLERKYEIAIMRSMGLKRKDVRNMFLTEGMILLLSASILGTLIGTYCAYLLLSNIAALLEIPLQIALSRSTIFNVFGSSIIISALGMLIIFRKVLKKSIMDIFREVK